MGVIVSQITSLTIVYSTVYSDADQRKHHSSASLAFVWGIHRGPVNSPHKWPVTRKMFLYDVIIIENYRYNIFVWNWVFPMLDMHMQQYICFIKLCIFLTYNQRFWSRWIFATDEIWTCNLQPYANAVSFKPSGPDTLLFMFFLEIILCIYVYIKNHWKLPHPRYTSWYKTASWL